MKIIIGIIATLVLVLALSYEREKTVSAVVTNTSNSLAKIQEDAFKREAELKYESWASTKIKIHVRARDTKTCMRILKIDVLNNEVVECNRDHDVEVRNDEVEKFRKEQEL